MARRGREAALKRQREKARQEKQEAKREKKLARDAEVRDEDQPDEQVLMEQYARLSESHEAGQITTEVYNTERHRIFVELGIESDD